MGTAPSQNPGGLTPGQIQAYRGMAPPLKAGLDR